MKKKLFGAIAAFAMVLSVFSFTTINAKTEIREVNPVAIVDGVNYASLAEAFAAASDEGIVTLIADVTLENRITIENNAVVTLDLNGHKLNQTLKGSIGATSSTIALFDANLTVKDSQGTGELFGYQCPVGVFKNSTFTLESGKLVGEWYGLSGHGMENNTTINILGGTIESKDPEAAAFYHPQTGAINMSGGKIIGSTGIQLCSGSMSVAKMSGGTIQATGEDMRADKGNGDGAVSDGAAVSVVNRPGYSGIPTVEISGGTFSSMNNDAVLAYTWKTGVASEWNAASENVKIHGGTFSSDISSFVTQGNKVFANDGTYVVAPAASDIVLDRTFANMEMGTAMKLTATVSPQGTLDTASWSSSNDKVATVDANGNVKAVAPGTAIITATANDVSATCTITVYKVEKPTIPTTGTDDDKTSANLDKSAVEVLTQTIKDVIKNIDTTTAICDETKAALKDAISNHKVISIEPKVSVVSNDDVNKDTVANMEKALDSKSKIAQYFELDMNITADGVAIGTINELTGKVQFTISIDKALIKEARAFYMLREHEGTVEKIEGTLKENEFTFETDKFSTFALVYDDSKTIVSNQVNTNDTSNTAVLITMMGLAIIMAGVTLFARKRATK